jgi:hypothetical protein
MTDCFDNTSAIAGSRLLHRFASFWASQPPTLAARRSGVPVFADGVTTELDVLDSMREPVFADPRTPVGFTKVTVDPDTTNIERTPPESACRRVAPVSCWRGSDLRDGQRGGEPAGQTESRCVDVR